MEAGKDLASLVLALGLIFPSITENLHPWEWDEVTGRLDILLEGTL